MSWVVTLVEDDDDIREHLAEVLAARGLKVVEARNGAEALELIRTRGIRPSLMALDLMMPVMDGWKLLEAQADEPLLSDVPVVVITAANAQGPFPPTVRAVFAKPFSLAAFLETVKSVCASIEPPKRIARGSDGLRPPLEPPDPDKDER